MGHHVGARDPVTFLGKNSMVSVRLPRSRTSFFFFSFCQDSDVGKSVAS